MKNGRPKKYDAATGLAWEFIAIAMAARDVKIKDWADELGVDANILHNNKRLNRAPAEEQMRALCVLTGARPEFFQSKTPLDLASEYHDQSGFLRMEARADRLALAITRTDAALSASLPTTALVHIAEKTREGALKLAEKMADEAHNLALDRALAMMTPHSQISATRKAIEGMKR